MKTGSLFAVAAELSATLNEADPKILEILKDFGMRIGTAYQIYDDCLDIAGSEDATGKTLGTDLRKGKFTLPVLIFLSSASEFERERCSSLILDGKCEEMSEILKNRSANGALDESITVGMQFNSQGAGRYRAAHDKRPCRGAFRPWKRLVRDARAAPGLMKCERDLRVPILQNLPSRH